MTEKLLQVPDIMRILDVSRPTVYRLMDSGKLKSIRVGRLRRIPQSALDEFIQGAA